MEVDSKINQDVNSDSDNDPSLTLHIHYHVGKGGLWGPYDFWMGVLIGLEAQIILFPLSVAASLLATKIYETLKSSKAEKDKFQSCRFDLLIPAKENSWIIVRIMRSAKFRTKAKIEEGDIRNAIISSVDRFDVVSKRNPRKTLLITAELRNDGDEIRLIIHEHVDFDLDLAPGIKQQIDDVKSGETIIITLPKEPQNKGR